MYVVYTALSCLAIRIPECGDHEFLLLESGIFSFGIRNSASRIQNTTNDWNLESKFY